MPMKRFARLFALVILMAPLGANALTNVTYTDTSTGGSVSSEGATVTGNANADAKVETHIGSPGTSKVIITTEADGVVHTQIIEKHAAPQKPNVQATTSATLVAQAHASTTPRTNFFLNFWTHIKLFFHFF